MDDLEAWGELAALLTDDPRALAAVRLAATDPRAYFAEHADALSERGIEEPDELETVIALVDALEDARELAYLDWRSGGDEVAGALFRLRRVRETGVPLDEVSLAADVESAAAAAGAALSAAGVAIVVLDEGSDAVPLVPVPAARLPRLLEVAARAGADVRVPSRG